MVNENRDIHIRRTRKYEIVAAVIELEKKGFECVVPIKKVYREGKKFRDVWKKVDTLSMAKKKSFVEAYEDVYYQTVMRKKDTHEDIIED